MAAMPAATLPCGVLWGTSGPSLFSPWPEMRPQEFLQTVRDDLRAWAGGVQEWWFFLANRRKDTRFGVFPHWFTLLEWLAIAASAITFTVLVFDRLYLREMAQELGADGNGGGFFSLITDTGKSSWVLVLTGAILIALSVATSSRFKGAARRVWHRVVLIAWYVFFSVAASGIAANILKLIFARARPEYVPDGMVWFTGHFTDTFIYGSFPSGHSTTAGALATALALLFPRLRTFLLLAGAWIAFSRPAVGVHFPSDALAGFALGAAFSYYSARNLAVYRLLFHFDEAGRVRIRGEAGEAYRAFGRQLTDRKSWQRRQVAIGSDGDEKRP